MAIEAIKAQKALERDNIRIGIALCHTVKPFPEQAIEKLCVSYKKIFVIEEHSFIGGFGSSLVNFVNKRSIKTKIYSYIGTLTLAT